MFSQSLETLRLIRTFLEEFDRTNTWFTDHEPLSMGDEEWGMGDEECCCYFNLLFVGWKQGLDYMVIDGSVSSRDRESKNTFTIIFWKYTLSL